MPALVLRNGIWQAVLRVPDPLTGKRKQVWRSTGERDKRKAMKVAARMEADAERGQLVPTDQTLLGDFLRRWLDDRTLTAGLQPLTVESYRKAIDLHIIPAIGHVRLCDLTPALLSAYYAEKLRAGRRDRRPGGLSPHKVHEHHAILHKALNDALKWGLVTRNVADAVDAPAVPKVEHPVLSRDQARLLVREARGHRLHALFHLAIATGLRQGELLALRWSDVDWEAGTLSVTRALKGFADGKPVYGPTKARRQKAKVQLHEADVAVLRRHREAQDTERARAGSAWHALDLVFCREDGSSLSADQVRWFFSRLLKDAGLPRMRFHDLRHSSATLLIESGEPVLAIAERLGHSTPATTQGMYGHVTAPMRSAAAAKMAEILGADEEEPEPRRRAR